MTHNMITTPIEAASRESLLITPRFDATPLASATGFIADAGKHPVLITCRHVVTGRHQETDKALESNASIPNNLVIIHNGAQKSPSGVDTVVQTNESLYHEDGSPRWIEHPMLGAKADIVALPLSQLKGIALMKVDTKVGPNPIQCRPSEMVSIVGYPFGKVGPGTMGIWAAGFIASEITLLWNGLPVFLVDSRSRPGQSGSPVFAYRTGIAVLTDGTLTFAGPNSASYRFLGVYSGRIHPESDIGVVWDDTAVRDLLNHASQVLK